MRSMKKLIGTDDNKKTDYEKIKALLQNKKDQGLDVLNDFNDCLTLAMKSLIEQKPLNVNSVTVLNAESITAASHLALFSYSDKFLKVVTKLPGYSSDPFHVRGLLEINIDPSETTPEDLPKAA